MNERIKELANIWANRRAEDEKLGIVYTFSEPALEQFAELIIEECAAQIIEKGTDWLDFAPSQTGVRPEYWAMAQQIKEHFGVEE